MILLPWHHARKAVLFEPCIAGLSVLLAYNPLKQHSSQQKVAQIKALDSVPLNRNTESSWRSRNANAQQRRELLAVEREANATINFILCLHRERAIKVTGTLGVAACYLESSDNLSSILVDYAVN